MRRLGTALTAVAIGFAGVARAETLRTGVIVIGPDAVSAGALQERLESSLSEMTSVSIVQRKELAVRLAAMSPAPTRDDTTLVALFVQAREAYFDDRLSNAMESIESASRIVAIGLGSRTADRASVYMWRSALFLAMNDRTRAEAEARSLFALAPDAKADLDTFRPSFGKFLDEIRPSNPRPAEIRVANSPPGASVQVDDHFVDSRFRVGPGVHKLLVRAPGFLPTAIAFDATPGLTINVAAALDVPSTVASSIEQLVWEDGAAGPLAELAKALAVDIVIPVSIRAGTVRAAVLKGGSVRRSDPVSRDGVSALVEWLAGSLGEERPETRLRLVTSAMADSAVRKVSVDFRSGKRFETALGGAGAAAEAAGEYGSSRVELRMAALSFARSQTTFATSDGELVVRGGTALGAAILASHAFTLASPRIGIRPNAGLRYQSDTSGGKKPSALFPAFSRSDALLGARIEYAFHGGASVESGGFLTSNLTWKSTNGWGNASVPVGVGGLAKLEWRLTAWAFTTEYAFERRRQEFAESYPVSSSTPLVSPRVQEQQQSFVLSAGYFFQ